MRPSRLRSLPLSLLLALVTAGCLGSLGGQGSDAGAGDDAAGGDDGTAGEDGSTPPADAPPAFTCAPPQASSTHIAGVVGFDPADPHPGDTLTVLVRSTNGTGRADAPAMQLTAQTATGTSTRDPQTVEGGDALYYYEIPDLPLGDVCVVGKIDGADEVAAKITVTPRPAVSNPDVVYKVTVNHQWSCAEQPSCGNYIEIRVVDENDVGIPGATVTIGQAGTTVPPIYNDTDPTSIPSSVVMDDNGHFEGQNYWPINENGLQVFKLSVAGAASDVATEITTGWWEDDLHGCNYCNTYCVNVWGHWSYSVTFKRTPGATEVCEVENDHGGMTACGAPRHIHHDPAHRACWPVQ